jgi:RNA polymerase sigma factor (sigma-70 family)
VNPPVGSRDLWVKAMNRDSKQVLTEWLVLSAQSGDERSFKELHDLWHADLRRMIVSRVETLNATDEISNDVWLAIARGLHRLDDPVCFPRWAFRIVDRRSADWIRQRSLARKREAVAANEAEQLAPAAAPSEVEVSDEALRLREMIARLPTHERELVNLYYVLGRSVAEIAEVLAIPAGTVKSRLFSVRETLKQLLERKLP